LDTLKIKLFPQMKQIGVLEQIGVLVKEEAIIIPELSKYGQSHL